MWEFLHRYSLWCHGLTNALRAIYLVVALTVIFGVSLSAHVDTRLVLCAYSSLVITTIAACDARYRMAKFKQRWHDHLLRYWWRTSEGAISGFAQAFLALLIGFFTLVVSWQRPITLGDKEYGHSVTLTTVLLNWFALMAITLLLDIGHAFAARKRRNHNLNHL